LGGWGLDLNQRKTRRVEKDKKMKIYGLLVLHFHQSSRRFFRTPNPTLELPSWGVESHQPLHFHTPPCAFLSLPVLKSSTVGLQDL